MRSALNEYNVDKLHKKYSLLSFSREKFISLPTRSNSQVQTYANAIAIGKKWIVVCKSIAAIIFSTKLLKAGKPFRSTAPPNGPVLEPSLSH